MPSLWSGCTIQKRDRLPHNIDGDCVFELPYDKDKLMASSSDGRPWKHWCTSKRQGFRGIRICKNTRCPNLPSCGKENKVQFKKMAENEVVRSRCGYEAQGISCEARKIWEFEDGKVIVFHCGEHKCSVKEQSPDIREAATTFCRKNTSAKPSQFPYQHLRGMLKEGKTVEDVYKEAKGMADLKKIQNIKQRVVEQENPVGHSFEDFSLVFITT